MSKTFAIKEVAVAVEGIPAKDIKDKVIIATEPNEIIRYVKNSFVLVDTNEFIKEVKAYISKHFNDMVFDEVRYNRKTYSLSVVFDLPTKRFKSGIIQKFQIVIFNSYISDYNLGVGLNIVFKDGGSFMLNDWEHYPTIRNMEKPFEVTLDKFKPTIEMYKDELYEKTLEFFKTPTKRFKDVDSFIDAFYSAKSETGKYTSNVYSIKTLVNIATTIDKAKDDLAYVLGFLRFNSNKVAHQDTDFYFYNRVYKNTTQKISEFIWQK